MCTTRQYAKAHRKPTKGSIKTDDTNTDGAIHVNQLRVGKLVSSDHFESILKGRTYKSMGELNADTYLGGYIFVDSMISFLHVEHQLSFQVQKASEKIVTSRNWY